jgi:hypothetical protein
MNIVSDFNTRKYIGSAITVIIIAVVAITIMVLSEILWVPEPLCRIKGNVTVTGERVYHLPNGKYYDRVIINPMRGEKYFCKESDALAAGWRKALEP